MVIKTIRIKKKGGGTRLQRVEVLKSGKYKFVKNSPSKSKKNTKTIKKRKGNRMARNKKRRGKRAFTLPIAPIAGLAAGLAGPIAIAAAGNPPYGLQKAIANYTGVVLGGSDFKFQRFDYTQMQNGLLPLVIGGLVHKFVGGAPLNMNRMLASANVPIIRI